jgi:hypothetical protein
MGFSFNPIDINVSLHYSVGNVVYEETYGDTLKQNATNIFQPEGQNDKALYVVDDPKVVKDVYQGNVQTTRSFSPPTHNPLFDPRDGKGISLHHQLGSVGYYSTGGDSGNLNGVQISGFSAYRYNIQDITEIPKLYVGVRRVGEPKWFYILGRDISAVTTINYQENYKRRVTYSASDKRFKTDVYVSGGDGVPNFDPMDILGITPMDGSTGTGASWFGLSDTSFDSRVLQMHVCYMPDNKYYLMLYNENLPRVRFPGSDIPKKYWMVLESYGVQ